jgi:hypothetical protein
MVNYVQHFLMNVLFTQTVPLAHPMDVLGVSIKRYALRLNYKAIFVFVIPSLSTRYSLLIFTNKSFPLQEIAL